MSDISKVINYRITTDSSISDDKETKKIVLNSYLREFPIVQANNSVISMSRKDLGVLCSIINNPPKLVLREAVLEGIIIGFVKKLAYFKKFVMRCTIKKSSGNMERKTRVYLHKIHRLAPVFNYRRAVANLNSLYCLFSRENFFPLISTQLAIVIYITDKLDKSFPKKIMQKNIRYLCSCSAYAFHNAKNHLDLDKLISEK